VKRQWIDPDHPQLSVRRQCELIGLCRSSLYYEPAQVNAEDLMLMRLLDEQYLKTPFYGSRRMTVYLTQGGHPVNRKRVQRLMRQMGIEGLAPGPQTSRKQPQHKVYPYLLRGVTAQAPDQIWAVDITYIPMPMGFMYLVAILDWYSRYVMSWGLSNTLDTAFCLDALDQALLRGKPVIFNSDQGVQFTSAEFTGKLAAQAIQISMDGRGRAFDNIFVERLWRTVKYEDIYLKEYASVVELERGLERYFTFYNEERPHQSLNYATPAKVYACESISH